MSTQQEYIEEVAQRLRRIETKLHKWGIKMGMEPEATTMTLRVEERNGQVLVHVPGYDVTLSQIRRAMEDAPVENFRAAFIMKDNELIGVLSLQPPQ